MNYSNLSIAFRPLVSPLAVVCCMFVSASACVDNGLNSDDGGANISADSEPVLVCDCPAVSAAELVFDNSATELSSNTVQDAISELDARELPDFASRITRHDNTQSTTSGSRLSVGMFCPGEAIAIGGGCSTLDPNIKLVKSDLRDDGFVCEWAKSAGVEAEGSARVVCVSLPPTP